MFQITDPAMLNLISQGSALIQVILIDLIMAGDNAVAVGLAAAGLAPQDRKKAIMYGLIGAIATRILFVLLTVELLKIIGLLLAGGILLLWVAWKMWRELREHEQEKAAEAKIEAAAAAEAAKSFDTAATSGVVDAATAPTPAAPKAKSMRAAIIQILIADVSMSLDNVLAVAGAAHKHVSILVFGLILSIVLMGVAAHAIANLLHKYRWIGYVGLIIILFVALRMMWEGGHQVLEHQSEFMPWLNSLKQSAGIK